MYGFPVEKLRFLPVYTDVTRKGDYFGLHFTQLHQCSERGDIITEAYVFRAEPSSWVEGFLPNLFQLSPTLKSTSIFSDAPAEHYVQVLVQLYKHY